MVSVKPKVTEGIYFIFISQRELMLLSCSRSDVNSKTEFFEIDNYPLSGVDDLPGETWPFRKKYKSLDFIVAFSWWFALCIVKIN